MLFKSLIFGSLLSMALADGSCDSNAWIQINPNSINGRTVEGDFYITSGQNSGNIEQGDLVSAFNKCFFDGGACRLDKNTGKFNCLAINPWNSAKWQGVGNIEFHCGNTVQGYSGYFCYDVKWTAT